MHHCFAYRAICSQLNITLQLEQNNSVPSTCFLSTNQRIAIFAGCSMAAVMLSFIRALLFYFICVNASRVLHNRMFASVLRAPVLFFDTNPIGELLYSNEYTMVWMVNFVFCERIICLLGTCIIARTFRQIIILRQWTLNPLCGIHNLYYITVKNPSVNFCQ